MKKRGKSIVFITLPIIVLVILYFAWNRYDDRNPSMPPLQTVVADVGDVSQRVVAYGSIQPLQMVTVGTQVSGIIDEINVDFNSVVRRGQILARIDPSTFEAAVSSARAELSSAQAAYELALVQWNRVQELREREFIAPSEVDQAHANLNQAKANVQVRQHALERAERELERCTILAPTNGIVISRNVDVGQTVAASLSAPVLFEIATDLRLMHIHANVSEADIGSISDGQKVRFRVDSHRNRNFTGEVIQVRNAPLVLDNVVHYETIIAVDNQEGLLKPGMTAEVNIITAESQNAIRVRNTALRARLPESLTPSETDHPEGYSGRVYVVRNGALSYLPVKTGLNDDLHTEIISGLQPGDTLAVGLSLRQTSSEQRQSLFRGNQATF